MQLGAMQDWPLRVTRLIDHAEREHGDGEIVTRLGRRTHDTNQLAQRRPRCARRWRRRWSGLGIKPGDRVATLAMNHEHHLIAWYGTIGMGGVLHTINPRLFDDQLEYIANHAEDRVLLYDRAFTPIVERMKPQMEDDRALHLLRSRPRLSAGFREWIDGEDGDYPWVDGDEREPIGLCYTSGTTGNPEGRAVRASLDHAPHAGPVAPGHHGPLDAGGGAADRPDVPRQRLGRSLGGAGDRVPSWSFRPIIVPSGCASCSARRRSPTPRACRPSG